MEYQELKQEATGNGSTTVESRACTDSGTNTTTTTTYKGYLIAVIRAGRKTKIYGSFADSDFYQEITTVNGRTFREDTHYRTIVHYIDKCIKLKDLRVSVNGSSNVQLYEKDSSSIHVLVIGTNAREQLNRFFERFWLEYTDKMEMLDFSGSNNPQSQVQQLPGGQMNIGATHFYRNQLHQQQQQQQQQQPPPPHGLRYANQPKVPKHRELPVDVPDSFVGIAKQSPKYPPPKHQRQISPPMPINNLTFINNAQTSISYNSTINSNANNNVGQQQPVPPIAQTTAANLVNHNSSLRSSIKLKQLEKSRNNQHGNYPVGQLQPAVNQAFELNEDDIPTQPQIANSSQINNQQASIAKQALKMKQSMPDLCSIYNRLQRNLNGEFADVTGDAKLAKLLLIYNTLVQTHNKQFRVLSLRSRHVTAMNSDGVQESVVYKVTDLLQSVIYLLRGEEMTNEAAELISILRKHEVDGVCSAYDRIAQSFEFAKSSRSTSPQTVEMISDNELSHQSPTMYNHKQTKNQVQGIQMDDYDYAPEQVQMDIENNLYQNSLHPLTDIDLSDGTCTKIVRIEKTSNQPLGATIKNEADGSVIIGRVVCGGVAHQSGLLHEGDEILEVNGVQMHGKSVNEVVNILMGMNGTLTFTIVARNYNKPMQRNLQEKIFVRAFFKYEGHNDDFIPCKDLSLSFDRGDILTIIDQSDPRWWQAHREGDSEWRLAGLIPSVEFLQQRKKDINHEEFADAYFKHEKKTLVSMLFNCPKGSSPRRRKKPSSIPFGPDEIPYYEEVCLYYPNKYRKRPIILVGPKKIGQREIVAKLLQDTNRFASAISHTSKPRQEHEQDGVDFHFVSRAQFESDKNEGKFIECGLYQNQYYGTSLDAMKEVVRSKKICIHLINYPSIFNFRQGRAGSELKPFFVFVKPDDSHPEKLRNIVASFSQPKSIEHDIKEIMDEVQKIESVYLPYFDLVITVSDVERAYQQLLMEIEKIEREPQWIPMFWQDKPSNQ